MMRFCDENDGIYGTTMGSCAKHDDFYAKVRGVYTGNDALSAKTDRFYAKTMGSCAENEGAFP